MQVHEECDIVDMESLARTEGLCDVQGHLAYWESKSAAPLALAAQSPLLVAQELLRV